MSAHSCVYSIKPAHSCLHKVHDRSNNKDLTWPKEVLIQRPVGLQSVTARVGPAGHSCLNNVRQKASSSSAKASPHSVDEGPAGGLDVDLKA